jgi:hypothetical protein
MTPLTADQVAAFSRRFVFDDGLLRSLRLDYPARGPIAAEVVLAVRLADPGPGADADGRVDLRIRFAGVDEYRFQKRSNTDARVLTGVRLGVFDGLVFVNLDDWVEPDEPAGLPEFRASDCYLAARTVSYAVERPGEAVAG